MGLGERLRANAALLEGGKRRLTRRHKQALVADLLAQAAEADRLAEAAAWLEAAARSEPFNAKASA